MTHGIRELGNSQEKKSVRVDGYLSSSDGEIVLQWALEGKGIMLHSEWDVLPFLESDRPVRILPKYTQSTGIQAVYQEPLYRNMKSRVYMKLLTVWCQQRLGKPDEGYQVMQIHQKPPEVLFAPSFKFRPDPCLLTTPQTLNVIMMM